MTDKERQQQILRRLGQLGTIGYHDPDVACQWILDGYDEMERLIAELKQVEAENEHHIRLAFIDAGANPARTWKEEAERLARLIGGMELFLDPKVIEEIERLRKENKELRTSWERRFEENL